MGVRSHEQVMWQHITEVNTVVHLKLYRLRFVDIFFKMMEMQELDGIDDEKVELSGKVFSIEKQQRFVEFQKDAKKYVIFVVA